MTAVFRFSRDCPKSMRKKSRHAGMWIRCESVNLMNVGRPSAPQHREKRNVLNEQEHSRHSSHHRYLRRPATQSELLRRLPGLRLVKLTVNFDDPGSYHLYYGDGIGRPGTILTFFPWPDAPKGCHGVSQVTQTSFAIPVRALDFRVERLASAGVAVRALFERFGEKVVSFRDPDGMGVELITTGAVDDALAFTGGSVPAGFALRSLNELSAGS